MEPRITPTPIGIGPRRSGVSTRQRPAGEPEDIREFYSPAKPSETLEPTPEFIAERVVRALIALKKGIFWDRGSIVNMVV